MGGYHTSNSRDFKSPHIQLSITSKWSDYIWYFNSLSLSGEATTAVSIRNRCALQVCTRSYLSNLIWTLTRIIMVRIHFIIYISIDPKQAAPFEFERQQECFSQGYWLETNAIIISSCYCFVPLPKAWFINTYDQSLYQVVLLDYSSDSAMLDLWLLRLLAVYVMVILFDIL